MTLRDEVWTETIRILVERGQFKITHLPFNESQRHLVRRTLKEMEGIGLLERDHKRAAVWYRGDFARQYLKNSGDTE